MTYPTAKFPGAIAGAADLLEQKNALPSANTPTLAASIGSGDTSFSVGTGLGSVLPDTNFALSVDDEIMFVGSRSGDTLSSITRGAEGTTASAHSAGAKARAVYTALSHNQVAAEVIALEQQVLYMPQLVGYASFKATGGVISKLVTAGVVANVTRTAVGFYLISLSPSQTNLSVACVASDDDAVATFSYVAHTPDFTVATASFTIVTYGYNGGSSAPRDPGLINVQVFNSLQQARQLSDSQAANWSDALTKTLA